MHHSHRLLTPDKSAYRKLACCGVYHFPPLCNHTRQRICSTNCSERWRSGLDCCWRPTYNLFLQRSSHLAEDLVGTFAIMTPEAPAQSPSPTAKRFLRVLNRTALLLLLLTVPALSTLAKTNWYQQQTDASHLTKAVKMKVAYSPFVFDSAPLRVIAKTARPWPEVRRICLYFQTETSVPSLALSVSPQHRAPPA